MNSLIFQNMFEIFQHFLTILKILFLKKKKKINREAVSSITRNFLNVTLKIRNFSIIFSFAIFFFKIVKKGEITWFLKN